MLGDIQAHMMKEAARPSTRRQDIIHPSEVAKTGWCPRATMERIRACREASDPFLKPPESYGVQLLNIFDEGHYIHGKWQNRLERMGDIWGNWKCIECDYVIKNSTYYDDRCPYCKSHAGYDYAEITLRNDDLLIAGHADGGVPRLNALIEIKSVGVGTARIEAPDIYKANSEGQKIDLQGLWRDIKEPFPAHVRQGQLYLHLCTTMDFEDEDIKFDRIIFLYESKFNQGAKEFVVNYDYEIVRPLLEQIEKIVYALNNGTSVECPSGSCKDCAIYGNKSVTEGLGDSSSESSTESDKPKRIKSTSETIGGSTRSSKRTV